MLRHLYQILTESKVVYSNALLLLQKLFAVSSNWDLNKQQVSFGQQLDVHLTSAFLLRLNLPVCKVMENAVKFVEESLVDLTLQLLLKACIRMLFEEWGPQGLLCKTF